MTSPGSLLLKFRNKYKYGLDAMYYRDVVRKKILNTDPIVNTTSTDCEIHALTSSEDWLNLIWTLKSFYYYSQRNYALCIHDDGSLDETHRNIFYEHFPDARIITRADADKRIISELNPYPLCLEFRQTNLLSPKVFDFLTYLESDRLLLLDSDVLFFAPPTDLLKRIENSNYLYNSVNRDIKSAYTVDFATVESKNGFKLQPRFNSGLGLIQRSSLNLNWIEEFLALPGISSHFWRIEQTIYALCSSRFGVDLLPSEYDVRLDRGIKTSPARHYVGKIRHLMYSEGIKHLVKEDFLQHLS